MDPTPGGCLDDVKLLLTDPTVQIVARLAKSPRVIDPDKLALGDLVECDFPGYAFVPLEVNLEGATDDQYYGEMGPTNVEFISGAGATFQQITALYVTKKIGADPVALVNVCLFDPPLEITGPDQVVPFSVTPGVLETPA